MKKLICLLLCIQFLACGEESTAQMLEGIWKLEKVDGENLTESEKSTSLTFFANGTYLQTRRDKQRTGTWKLKGQTLEIEEPSKGTQQLEIVEITNKTLTLMEPEKSEKITLVKKVK